MYFYNSIYHHICQYKNNEKVLEFLKMHEFQKCENIEITNILQCSMMIVVVKIKLGE